MRGAHGVLGLGLATATALLTACAPPESAPEAGAEAAAEHPRWTAELDLRIGSLDDPDYALTFIRSLEVGPDGSIYTLHTTEQLIRVFDRDGQFVGTIGGRGGGPGEFQRASNMGWVGDTLWVRDVTTYRFSQFTAAGEFLGSFSVPFTMGSSPEDLGSPRAEWLTWDGTLVGSWPAWNTLVADGTLTHYEQALMERDGTVTDTLPPIRLGRNWWTISDPDNARGWESTRQEPFADGPLWSFAHDEHAIIVVDREVSQTDENPSFRVSKLTFDGDTLYSRSYPFEPIPIRAEDVDSILDAVAESMGASTFFSVTAARARELAAATLYRPPFRPGVAALRVARDGTIWLSHGPVDSLDDGWSVLDPHGEPVAEVLLPIGTLPHVIDPPYLWATETDELDVPYVVRYRIEGAP